MTEPNPTRLLRAKACRDLVKDPDGRQCSPDALVTLDRVAIQVLQNAERLASEEGRRRVDHYHVRRAFRQIYRIKVE